MDSTGGLKDVGRLAANGVDDEIVDGVKKGSANELPKAVQGELEIMGASTNERKERRVKINTP